MQRYSGLSRLLHWLTALIILVFVIPLGLWLAYFKPESEPLKMQLYNLHESLGLVIFLLALLRLANRLVRKPPPLAHDDVPPLAIWLARISHAALYGLLLLIPITGFLATNAWGFPLSWFNLLPLPSPLDKNEALAQVLSTCHWVLAGLLGLFLMAHILGAAFHRLVRRDSLASRMF